MGLIWLRMLVHPLTLWLFAQGLALYFYLNFSPLPRSAVERWLTELRRSFHQAVSWVTAPWRALQRVRELEVLTAQLQQQLSLRLDTPLSSPIPIGSIGDFSAIAGYRFLPAKVVYRTFFLRENYALLDKGGREGLYPGLGVLSERGVIGIIAETTATTSIMYALFHKDVHLSAMLPRHNMLGITSWQAATLNRLNLDYVPLYTQVEPGEEVWTASNSLIFPAGLRIGRVETIRSDFTRGFHAIELSTYADWGRTWDVFVLLPPS
ncbi:MAG: rod shape-determining protein MreC [Bacteroidia bacterium]|nr:rod shape-determining protein MreC [Bacteroidia bacterium]